MKTNFITMPRPCSQDWKQMTPNDTGSFCSKCAVTVIDFTTMTTDEIVMYLNKNQEGKVCGRVKQVQLNDDIKINISKKVLFSQQNFMNIFLLALVVCMGSMLFSCKKTSDGFATGEIYVPETTPQNNDTVKKHSSNTTTTDSVVTEKELESTILVGDFMFGDSIKKK